MTHWQQQVLLGLLALAACASAQQTTSPAPTTEGEVAYAAPATTQSASDQNVTCVSPCYVVDSYWPWKTCRAECNPDVCNTGSGAYQSLNVCCSSGVAFPEGCTSRPSECWVVESYALKTCVRDDRKCNQGYGVYGTEATCCAPKAAFPDGCANVTKAAQPCWVADTYYPSQQCRQSRTLCAADSGVKPFPSKEACCAAGGAFGQGCSAYIPPVPCWVVAEPQYPQRRCRRSNDAAVCYKGSGVFQSEEICCAPGAGFSEGCTAQPAPAAAAPPAGLPATAATPASAPPATAATAPPAAGSLEAAPRAAAPNAMPAAAPVAAPTATPPAGAAPTPGDVPNATIVSTKPAAPAAVSTLGK